MVKAPVFVKIEEYEELLKIIGQIKAKMDEARGILGKINELKNEEDVEMRIWGDNLDEVERKVDFIEKTLQGPEI